MNNRSFSRLQHQYSRLYKLQENYCLEIEKTSVRQIVEEDLFDIIASNREAFHNIRYLYINLERTHRLMLTLKCRAMNELPSF